MIRDLELLQPPAFVESVHDAAVREVNTLERRVETQWVTCPVCAYDGVFVHRDGTRSCSRCAFRAHNEQKAIVA